MIPNALEQNGLGMNILNRVTCVIPFLLVIQYDKKMRATQNIYVLLVAEMNMMKTRMEQNVADITCFTHSSRLLNLQKFKKACSYILSAKQNSPLTSTQVYCQLFQKQPSIQLLRGSHIQIHGSTFLQMVKLQNFSV